jgi:cytochrome c553
MEVGLTSIGGLKVRIGISVVVIAIAITMTITNMAITLAGNPKAAEETAENVCAGCHGPYGASTNPLWPNLAGQKEQYLIKALKDYRDANRSDQNMEAFAEGLSDEEIEDLAAYYAGLPPGN